MKMTRSQGVGIHFMAAVVCISWCELAYAQDQKPRTILQGHTDRLVSLAFSPDGTTLASGSPDRTIRLWDAMTGKSMATLNERIPYSLHFSPDGKSLATVHTVEIGMWDLASRKRRTFHDEDWMSQCIRFYGCFSPDGKLLAVSGLCISNVSLWDVKTGKLLRLLEEKSVDGYRLFTDIRFTPDGKSLLAYGSVVGLRKWDVATGKSLPTVDLPEPFRTPDRENTLEAAFSPDCKFLTVSIPPEEEEKNGENVVKAHGYVTILDVATGKPTATFRGFGSYDVWYLTYSRDGKTLAAGWNYRKDSVATLWDIATNREIASYKTNDDRIRSMAFSPDGKTLAIGYEEKTIRLWDVPSRK